MKKPVKLFALQSPLAALTSVSALAARRFVFSMMWPGCLKYDVYFHCSTGIKNISIQFPFIITRSSIA